jgi:hypothetical protein
MKQSLPTAHQGQPTGMLLLQVPATKAEVISRNGQRSKIPVDILLSLLYAIFHLNTLQKMFNLQASTQIFVLQTT